jgi:hypothetical protein
MAMTLIERIDVTSAVNLAYTFSNIPQSYIDLMLIANIQNNGTSADGTFIRLNGDTGNNYIGQVFRYTQGIGTNGGYISQNAYVSEVAAAVGTATYANFSAGATMYIPNYRSTSTAKTINSRFGSHVNTTNSQNVTAITAFLWTGTAAITSISLSGYGTYPTSNTTYSLYGIS